MSKILRAYSTKKIYHIILKGIDNQDMFYDDQDRRVFLEDILKSKQEFEYRVYAYSLMDNHVHMVIKAEDVFLSKAMQSLMIRYVHYFNRKYKRIGTLVQNRFKSKNVEDLRYFLEVCRYVHRNPENAKMAKTEEYEWSSYQEYLGNAKIIDKNVLLAYYNNDINEFIKDTLRKDSYEMLNELAEYEIIPKLTDTQVSSIIAKIFNIKDVSELPSFFKSQDKIMLKESIEKMKLIKGTNKTQIARVIRKSRTFIEQMW